MKVQFSFTVNVFSKKTTKNNRHIERSRDAKIPAPQSLHPVPIAIGIGDVVVALADYGITVTIYDPWANPVEVMHEYGLTCHSELASPSEKGSGGEAFDAVVLGVAHKEFLSLNLASLQKENSVLYDVKGILGTEVDGKL